MLFSNYVVLNISGKNVAQIMEMEDIRIQGDTSIVSCRVAPKNSPSGPHKCILCGTFINIFTNCPLPIGGSEGYGEQRICVSCENKRQKESKNTEMKDTFLFDPPVRNKIKNSISSQD